MDESHRCYIEARSQTQKIVCDSVYLRFPNTGPVLTWKGHEGVFCVNVQHVDLGVAELHSSLDKDRLQVAVPLRFIHFITYFIPLFDCFKKTFPNKKEKTFHLIMQLCSHLKKKNTK